MPAIVDLTAQGLEIAAGATAFYRAQLVDEDRTPIPAASLDTLQLTLADPLTGAIVNGVEDRDILNTDRGSVDASGNLKVTLGATGNEADTLLPGSTAQDRCLILEWTYNGGTTRGGHQVNFRIVPLAAR